MLNTRLTAAREVATHLIASERAIDAAVMEVSLLTACMPRARVEANFGAAIGQGALERSAAAFAKLVEARREIVAAHQELSSVQTEIGLATYAIGGLEDKKIPAALSLVDAA